MVKIDNKWYKIDSRLFITHFFGFRGLQEIQNILFVHFCEKKTSEKYFTKKFWKMLLKCISQMYSSECIFQVYLSRYLTVFWGQKSLGFGVNTKKIIMMFGIIIKGILMMLVFIIMTDVGIISICTDIMITDTPSFVLILI